MIRRVEILLFLCWYLVRRPSWAYYWMRSVVDGRTVHRHPFRPDPARIRTVEAAVAELLPATAAAVGEPFDPSATPAHPAVPRSFDGSPALLALLTGVIRGLRPMSVVEVGVARGATSRAILEGLRDQGGGRLSSVEFPVPRFGYRTAVGSLVPAMLRDRWELTIGPAESKLAPLMRLVGGVDLFLHDARHGYVGQRDDLERALSYLRPGAIAIMDDLLSSAFTEVCDRHGLPYFLVAQPGKTGLIGIFRFPGGAGA